MHGVLVEMDGQGFGEEVCEVVSAVAEDDVEVALGYSVLYPVESHVHGFGALQFDGLVTDANGRGVVAEDGGGRLGMAVGSENGAVNFCDLGIHEDGCVFCFGCGGYDHGDDGAHAEEWSVDVERAIVVAHVVNAACY